MVVSYILNVDSAGLANKLDMRIKCDNRVKADSEFYVVSTWVDEDTIQ